MEYPLDGYYKHSGMSDGHLNKCKSCCKKQAKEREDLLRQDPNWMDAERIRAREKYFRLYKGVKQSYEASKRYKDLYKEKYPEKIAAKNKASNCKPKLKGNHLHHWSYNKEHYQDLIELPRLEHAKLHRYMIYDQERMMYRTTNGVLLDTKETHIAYYETLKDKP